MAGADGRKHPRINVGSDHTLQFIAKNTEFKGLELANLSTGGCCSRVPRHKVEFLEVGMAIHFMVIVHQKLPHVPLIGRIAWIMGGQHRGRNSHALVGIAFSNPNPQFLETLGGHLENIRETLS